MRNHEEPSSPLKANLLALPSTTHNLAPPAPLQSVTTNSALALLPATSVGTQIMKAPLITSAPTLSIPTGSLEYEVKPISFFCHCLITFSHSVAYENRALALAASTGEQGL